MFEENPSLGHFIGIEHTLRGSGTEQVLTPDITVVYNNDTSGLLFDLKYSLPSDTRSVKDELQKLSKYSAARDGWGVRNPVQARDFVLVCHADDVKRTGEAATEIYSETSNTFSTHRISQFGIGQSLHLEIANGRKRCGCYTPTEQQGTIHCKD